MIATINNYICHKICIKLIPFASTLPTHTPCVFVCLPRTSRTRLYAQYSVVWTLVTEWLSREICDFCPVIYHIFNYGRRFKWKWNRKRRRTRNRTYNKGRFNTYLVIVLCLGVPWRLGQVEWLSLFLHL